MQLHEFTGGLLAIKKHGDRLEREILRLHNEEVDVEELKREPRDINELRSCTINVPSGARGEGRLT